MRGVWRFLRGNEYRWWGTVLLVVTAVFLGPALIPPAGTALGVEADMRGLFYPWLATARDALWHGRLPLWDPDLFAGYPFLSNPQVGFFYPPVWLSFLLPVRIGVSWYIWFHMWVAGLGMYMLMRQLGSDRVGAALASLTLTFSGFVTVRIYSGHTAFLATNLWLPWIWLGLLWATRRGTWQTAVFAGIPVALAILSGHTTSLIYIGLATAIFLLYLLLTNCPRTLVLRQALIAGIVGLLLSGIQLLPLIEFSASSARVAEATFEFASRFSMPFGHLVTLLVPEYFGEPTRAGYWSVPNFTELTYYAGLLPLLGIPLAIRRPTYRTWLYLALIVIGLLLALGQYGFLYRLAYNLLPPFRLARAPGRAAYLFTFGVAGLLADTLTVWRAAAVAQRREWLGSWWRWLVGITAVLGLTTLVAIGAVFASVHPTDTSGRLWHQIGGWAWAVLLLVTGGLLLWHVLTSENINTRRYLVWGLLLFVVIDLWTFGYKFIQTAPVAVDPFWTEARQIIGETDQRVLPWGLNIFLQNGAKEVGLRSVFGYNALEVAANIELAASVPDPRSTAYDVLGVAYVLSQGPLDNYLDGERPLSFVGNGEHVWVYQRARVLPIVRLVGQAEVIPDRQLAINRVHAPDFNPETAVILSDSPDCEPAPPTNSHARVLTSTPGYWQIETTSDTPAILVVSETAYPGWQVNIDGQPAQPLTAYTAIRAVCVPPGTHIVEWQFVPRIFWEGGALTLVGFLILGWAYWRNRLAVKM